MRTASKLTAGLDVTDGALALADDQHVGALGHALIAVRDQVAAADRRIRRGRV